MTEAMTKTQIEPDPVAAQLNNAPERHALLSVENLSAYYGKTQAVKDVTLGIMARAVTAIIGPSGCGKSTLLRCMNRMHEVDARGAGRRARFCWMERTCMGPLSTSLKCGVELGWSFRSPTHFRPCRSSRTWRPALS